MTVVSSLPDRPLTDAELTSLNRSDALELAVDVSVDVDADPGPAGTVRALLLATGEWVRGLAYLDGGGDAANREPGWTVVETVDLRGDERFDAMQRCEAAVRRRFSDRGNGE